MSFVSFLRFSGWPALTGVLAAAVLLLLFPQLLKPGSPSDGMLTEALTPLANDSWEGPVSYASAVKRAAPSVVNIYTRKQVQRRRHPILDDPAFRRFFNSGNRPQSKPQIGLGSGVILSEEGFILTNLHVVEGAEQIEVQLQDGRHASAQVVGSDADTDLTVLKIELDNLTPITVGDPMHASVGDVVLAIGNPHGYGQTVTQGIISATGRYGFSNNVYENYIQTDAAINPGNSGGALIDVYGNLLGINTLVLDQVASQMANGISFATPADAAMKVLKDIVEHGRVIRGWLGIGNAHQITAKEAKQMGLGAFDGWLIISVFNGSPAHQAGLRPGDIITRMNEHRIVNTDYGRTLIANMMPGDKIELEIIRRGESITVTATAGTTPQVQKRG